MSKFDLNGARDAGYSDTDILEGLAQRQPNFNLKAAREAGYDDTTILEGLAQQEFRVTTAEKVKGALSDVFSGSAPAQPAAQPAAAAGITALRGGGASGSWEEDAPKAEQARAPWATEPDTALMREKGFRAASESQRAADNRGARMYTEDAMRRAENPTLIDNRSFDDKAVDVAASVNKGIGQTVEMAGTVYGLIGGDMDNALRKKGSAHVERSEGAMSQFRRDELAAQRKRVKYIEENVGKKEAFFVALVDGLTDPLKIVEQIPQLVVGGGAGRVAGGVAGKVAGAAAGDTAAVGTAVGANAAMAGADPAGDAYDRMMKQPDELWQQSEAFQQALAESGGDVEAAKHAVSLRASRQLASVVGGASVAVSFLPGGRSIENVVVGKGSGLVGGAAGRGVIGAVGEGAGEAFEEGGGTAGANLAVKQIDPSQDVGEGVAAAAGEGAGIGGAMGGVAGALGGARAEAVDPGALIGQELQRGVDGARFSGLSGGPGDGPGEADYRAAVKQAFAGQPARPTFNPAQGGLTRAANIALDNGMSQRIADEQAAIAAAELLDEETKNADQGTDAGMDPARAAGGDRIADGGDGTAILQQRVDPARSDLRDAGSTVGGAGQASAPRGAVPADVALNDDVDAEETRIGMEVDRQDAESLRDFLGRNVDPATNKPIHSEGRRIELATELEQLESSVAQAEDYLGAAPKAAAPAAGPIARVGTTPKNTEDITVRDGVVYMGDYPAQNFETGEDITVTEASFDAVSRALKDGGALSTKQRIYSAQAGTSVPAGANPYKRAYETMVSGSLPQGLKDAELAKAAFDAGKIKSAGDLRRFEEKGYPKALLPKAPKPPKVQAPAATADEYAERARKRFIKTIKDIGGISVSEARDITGEAGGNANKMSPGLFRRDGNALDLVARRLNEAGYLSDADYNDVDGGVQAVRDLVNQALGRDPVMTGAEQERYNELLAEEQRLAEEMTAADETLAEMLADEVSETQLDDIADDLPDLDAGTTDTAASMRAMGFSEQEIEDAINEQAAKDHQAAGGSPAGARQEGAAAGQDQAAEAGFALQGQTPAAVKAAEEEAKTRAAAKAKADADAEARARADSERDGFSLTGSDRAADANPGQADIFAQPGKLEAAASKIDDALDAALDELAAALKPKGQLNSGIDPAILALGVKVGSLYVAKGVVKFAQYSQSIIDALKSRGIDAEQIKPYLKQFYAATKQAVDDATFDQMDDDRTVRGFDLEKMAPKVERRRDAARRQAVADMDVETLRRELLTDAMTGLGNRRAYDESEKLAAQVSIDADSLKWINDNLGHESGDKLLAAIGQALGDETPNAYHISGDEFVVQAATEAEARAIMDRAVERMAGATLEGTDANGNHFTLNGVGVSYGIAGDLHEAERKLAQHKAERERNGQRAARGEVPPNATIASGRGEDRPDHAAAEEEVSPQAAIERTPENLPVAESERKDRNGRVLAIGDNVRDTGNGRFYTIGKFNRNAESQPLAYDTDGRVIGRPHRLEFVEIAKPAEKEAASETGPIERIVGDKLETNLPEVEHITTKGKPLKGVITKTLTLEQARSVDKFAWKKDGGIFVRMRHVVRPEPAVDGRKIMDDNRAMQKRWDAAHERSYKLDDPAVTQAREAFENGDIEIEEYEAALTKAEASGKLENATAPEHVAGVDDRELGEIVDEFNKAQARATSDPEAVTHVFDAPAKGEIVRLGDKVKVYHKENGWMTPSEARAEIQKWKEHAAKQGETHGTENSQRVVLSLFDLSGEWSKPWEEAGYQVYRFDIQDDAEVGDVNNFSTGFFNDWFGSFDGMDIYAILAACPCTDFAVSGARHFSAKDEDGRTVASVKLVHQTLNTIEYFKPAVWAIENPVGRIEKLGGLPPWRLSFDPNHLGDPYTKKTLLWGRFNGDLPIAPVDPVDGSKMHRLYGGKSQATKNARSVTPEGFSYGFFMANNAVDHPAMAIANKYDRLDRGTIEQAVARGVTEAQIDEAVEDLYYMDLDDAAANAAIAELEPPTAQIDGEKADDNVSDADIEAFNKARKDASDKSFGDPVQPGALVQAMNDLADVRQRIEDQGRVVDDRLLERERQLRKLVNELSESGQKLAPGTRVNGATEKAAADRLELLAEKMSETGFKMNSPEWAAMRSLKSVAEELRKPRTVVSVNEILQSAWEKMGKYGAYADVIEEVMDSLVDGAKAQETREPKTLDEFVGAVDAGYKAHYDYAGTDGVTVWIEKTDKGWVVKSREDGSGVTATHGGVSPVGGWDKLDALKRVERDAKHRFTEWKPLADQAPSPVRERTEIKPGDRLKYTGSTETWLGGRVRVAPGDVVEVTGYGSDKYHYNLSNGWQIEHQAVAKGYPWAATDAPVTEGKKDAGNLSEEGVPAGRADGNQGQRQPGDRTGEPLDAGVAGSGANTAGPRGVSGGVRAGDRTGTGRAGSGDGQRAPRADGDRGNGGSGNGAADGQLDHTISDADGIGEGGLAAKYRDNIAAIRIIKALEADGRVATAEERRSLARYVGWGALKGVFDPNNKTWAKQHKELRELLNDAEWDSARASMRNAHYTSPTVIKAMYEAIDQLGFKGGRILEPSMGSGNFFGMMPASMRGQSKLHGVELDNLTSRLARALYPNAVIATATGFQEYQVPAGYFDMAFGNPPFGSEPIVDRERNEYSGFSIHNYFIARMIDKTRDGGIVPVIVSHSFMDAMSPKAREWIAKRANLLGAVRLPQTAFKNNAGTEVVTDILFFQKTATPEKNPGWINASDVTLQNPKSGDSKAVSVNDYFSANPRNVLGRQSLGGSMYAPNTYTVEPTGDLEDQLTGFINGLPANVYQPIERAAEELTTADNTVPDGVKPGSYYLDGKGAVRQRGNDVAGMKVSRAWEAPNAGADNRMRGMIQLRDLLRRQMRMELGEANTKELEAARTELNKTYDAFVKAYGYLNSQTNRRIFLDDTESALLQALEFDYDPGVTKAKAASSGLEEKKPSATKADILQRRVLFPPSTEINVNNAKDALLASLNEKGKVDMSYMAAAYGKTESEIVDELGDVLFNDPQAGYVTADEYLAGDVKTKLDEAREAAKEDPRFERNVKELEKVIPADKLPSEIFASIGANWIPNDVYQTFAEEITGSKEVTTSYLGATAQWFASMERGGDLNKLEGEYGTGKVNSFEIFKLMLNGRAVEVKKRVTIDGKEKYVTDEESTEAARQKMDKIKQRWESWVWNDPERAERLAGIFNDKHNRTVKRGYDGSHMTLPGVTPSVTLRPHQKNVIWRGIQERNVLLDHVVGAGKTYAMTGIIMEMKRLGIARKPLFAVPNHLTLQWRSDFSRLYPAANVLAATPEDFSKDNRERLFAKIATGEYDAVIVGHSSLKKIALNPEIEQRMYKEQLDEIAASIEELKRERGDRNIIRDMEKIKATLEAKIEKLVQLAGKRDKVVTFDELGIDALFVDEMHEFKNLFFYTQKQRVSGLGNPSGSGKAFDLFMKVRWMQQTFGERTPFVTATGTPVSNSLSEMFTMQRYMRFDELKRDGLHLFDAWSRMYGEDEFVYEVAPSGVGYRISQRFSKFKNLPSLMGHYQSFADVVTLQDLKDHAAAAGKRFPVPKIEGGRQKNIVAKRSTLQRDFFGVPQVRRDEDGRIVFEIDNPAAMRIEENPNAKDEKQAFILRGDNSASYHPTREDAELALTERALTPVLDLDPKSLVGQFNNLRQLTRETKGKINALSLTGLANKAGLDYRLIDPNAPDFDGSKINMAVDKMVEKHKQWDKDRGTQLVFCDLSVPLSAKAAAARDEKRLYVLDDKGELTHKKGTLNTIEDYEGFPFYLVRTGKGAQATVQAYEPVSGILLRGGFADRTEAKAWAAKTLSTESGRDKWFEARESREAITAERIAEYRDDAGLEVDEDGGNEFSPDDLEAMSGSSKFSVYDDIKAKLVARGIKENEIAFIHDYNTPKQKAELFKRVKAGDIRILMGSTPKLGAGTNVQDRLVALHHVDAPWRPSDLEQREGRIIRQGNILYDRDPDGFEVFIGRYATEQTYDTRRWQLLEHKAAGIEQLRKYSGENEIDDVAGEAANAADMKAAASGNPLILEETKLRTEVKRLTALRRAHEDSKFAMGSRLKHLRNKVNTFIPMHLADIEDAMAKSAKHPEPEEKGAIADIVIDGKKASDRETAEKLVGELFTRARAGGMFGSGGKIVYRGVTYEVKDEGRSVISLNGPLGGLGLWSPAETVSSSGVLTRLSNSIDRLPGLKQFAQAELEEAKAEIQSIESRINGEFAEEADLAAATAQHAVVQRRLMKSTQMDAVQPGERAEFMKELEARKKALSDLGYGKAVDEATRDAEFIRDGISGSGLTEDEMVKRVVRVQNVVKRIKAGWKNAPEIIVVPGMGDSRVPQTVRDRDADMRANGASGEPRGFITGGRVYIVAGQNKTAEDVITTLAHEVLGHAGLRGFYGSALTPILRQIATTRRADVEAKAAEYGLDMESERDRLIAAEEVLAEMAQTRPELGFVKRAIAAIRNWLRAHGMDLDMTDADIVQAFLLPARNFIESGRRGGTPGDGMNFMRDTWAGYATREEYEAKLEADRQQSERLSELYRAEIARNPLKAPGKLESVPRQRAGNGDTWAGYATREEYERARGNIAFSRDGLQSEQKENDRGQIQAAGYGLQAQQNARRSVGGTPRAGWAGATRIRRNDGKPAAAARGAGVALAPEHFAQAALGKNTGNPSSGLGVWFALTGQDEVGRYGPVIEQFNLDIRRPKVYTTDTFPGFESAAAAHRHREQLRAQGYDGIVVDHRSVDGPVHAVAFDAEQVIYQDDGPLFSRQKPLPGTTTPQPAQPTRQPALGVTGGFAGSQAAWAEPIDSAFDDFVYKWQNKHVDMKRVVQAVTDAAGQLADKWNPYLQEELFHGRAAKRTLDFVDRELNPIMKQAAELGLTLEEIDHHLWARHAEEANKLIASRDPNMQDAGSGMKTADARAYFAGLDPKKRADLTKIADRIDAIIADTRQLYVDYGLIDQDTANEWAGMFKHYVPLMREDKDGAMGLGQGYSVRGKEVKHRTGSTRAVVDVLANIAMQRERAIVRGEKNRVAVALAGAAKLNPNPDFWTFDKVPTERVLNETTGQIEQRPDPRYKERPNVIVAKIRAKNGRIEERAIVFNEENDRAMRMAEALKNIDVKPLEGVVMTTFAAITRWLASVNTQYNPVFGVVNLTRDVQGAMLNLASTPLAGDKARIFRDTFSALPGLYRDTRAERKGGRVASRWAAEWEEFTREGGQTGYRDMFATSEDRAKALRRALDPTAWMDTKLGRVFTAGGALRVPLSVAQKQAGWIFDWLSDFNLTMENAVRLAAYKAAKDRGMTRQQAASIAKNLTVNFNRRGQVGQQAGALFAFFNAAVQGTARIGDTMTKMEPGKGKSIRLSGVGKAIVSGGVLLGVMQSVMLMLAGFDDDEPPEFVRERNFIIPLGPFTGEKNYVTIPYPLGYHVLPNFGRHMVEAVRDGETGRHGADMLGIVAGAFYPFGSSGVSLQTVAPSAFDPFVALAENKDWTGKSIYREAIGNDLEPGFERAKDTASAVAKALAEWIHYATGGTDYTAGGLSPSPDAIDYLIGQFTGGVGREYLKAEQTVTALGTGEDLPPHKIPLVGRFYGTAEGKSGAASQFYANLERAKRHEMEVAGRRKDHADPREYIADNPDHGIWRHAKRYEAQVKALRKRKLRAIEAGADRDAVRAIDDTIAAKMMEFNAIAKDMREE